MIQIGFVVEQALGHVTHGKNLQAIVPQDPAVNAHWVLPAWEVSGLAARLPLFRSNWTVRAGWRARRGLAAVSRGTSLDALFFHTQVTAVLAHDWLRRVPSVISLDATPLQYDALGEFYDHPAGPNWLERRKWRLNRDAFGLARQLVTWSQWAKDGLVADYEVPAGKITVIPPGVDTRAWTRPEPRRRHEGPVKILFVGGNLARKGGLLLLNAFQALREQGEVVELHLVTRDKVAPRPGLVVYNDMQPNSDRLKRLYFDCDIFCLPTQGDALPMVLSEAGAAGLPVVSTRLAAIPEIVQDEATGFLVPRGDEEALVAALRRLIVDPDLRLRQGVHAAEVIRRRFDATENVWRLLALLKEMADTNKARE